MSKCKIGIITLYGQTNYGNRLQNLALQETLKSLGYQPETIVYYSSYEKDYLSRAIKLLRQPFKRSVLILLHAMLRKLQMKSTLQQAYLHRPSENAQKARQQAFDSFGQRISKTPYILNVRKFDAHLDSKFDAFIVGSDQVWNPYSRGTRIEFLRFASPGKRISFAASFGINSVPLRFRCRYRAYLYGMKHISVREKEGADIVKNLTKQEVPVHLDPTMLLDVHFWATVAYVPSHRFDKPYLLTYFLGQISGVLEEAIQKASTNHHMDILRMNDPHHELVWQAGPEQFLGYIQNAFIILTDSFHGTVFSILFEKQFYVFQRKGETASGFSRITSLLEKLGLTDRIVREGQQLSMTEEIDYSSVSDILARERKKAKDYLLAALESCTQEQD